MNKDIAFGSKMTQCGLYPKIKQEAKMFWALRHIAVVDMILHAIKRMSMTHGIKIWHQQSLEMSPKHALFVPTSSNSLRDI